VTLTAVYIKQCICVLTLHEFTMEACKRQKVCYAPEWIWVGTGVSYSDDFSVCKM